MTAPTLKQQVAVCIGKVGQAVGQLTYVKEGAREYSAFAYGNVWLSDPARHCPCACQGAQDPATTESAQRF